jgi:hypothetical protein
MSPLHRQPSAWRCDRGQTAKAPRATRTIPVDFHDETTSCALRGHTKAWGAFVFAFLLARGVPLLHQASCSAGGCLTRPAPDARVRLGGLPLWRLQCPTGPAVVPVLPPVVLRYRPMRPGGAREALLAPHGGLSVERCAVIGPLAPMAVSRLGGSCGHQSLVPGLPRGGLPGPRARLADEKPSRGLPEPGSLPPRVSGRVLWPLGETTAASAAVLPQSSQAFQRAALQPHAASRARGILTDGCDRTVTSRRPLCPGGRLGTCRRHALHKLPKNLMAIASPVRRALRTQWHTLVSRARQRQG